MPHLKKAPTEDLVSAYENGLSTVQIATMFDMSRQAVHERLVRYGVTFRQKKLLPFVMYDNIKFTISSTTGYYRNTDRSSRGCAISLHRYKYQKEIKVIPDDWDIHHIDFNKLNNKIENLTAMPKAEHTKLHRELKCEKL